MNSFFSLINRKLIETIFSSLQEKEITGMFESKPFLTELSLQSNNFISNVDLVKQLILSNKDSCNITLFTFTNNKSGLRLIFQKTLKQFTMNKTFVKVKKIISQEKQNPFEPKDVFIYFLEEILQMDFH